MILLTIAPYTTLTLLFLLIFLIHKHLTTSYDYWKRRNIPYIEPILLFGNAKDLLTRKLSIGQLVNSFYKKANGDIIGFWILRTPHLLIKSPSLIKKVLVKDFNNFSDRTILSDEKVDAICSKLLFVVNNPEWKLMRKKVTPIFTTTKLKNMVPLMAKAADDLNKYLMKNAGVVEAKEVCAKYTTDVLTSCAFGVDARCFDDEKAPFRELGRELFDLNFVNGFRFILYFMLPKVVKAFKVAMFNPKPLGFLANGFIETIRSREITKVRRNDLIDLIIDLKKDADIGEGIKFEGNRIVALPIQFFLAGFETTSSGLGFILYELACHKEIQKKAREEIQELLEQNETVDYESLQSLKYLDKIILETLRLHPILPFLDRMTLADYKDDELGVVIPKGTPIYVSVIGIHRDPNYYPNPEIFDPERFSQENIEKRPPFTYFAFGQGPHNCIGERFAMIATKLGLINVLKDFEIEVCEETQIPLVYNPLAFLLQTKGGLHLGFKRI